MPEVRFDNFRFISVISIPQYFCNLSIFAGGQASLRELCFSFRIFGSKSWCEYLHSTTSLKRRNWDLDVQICFFLFPSDMLDGSTLPSLNFFFFTSDHLKRRNLRLCCHHASNKQSVVPMSHCTYVTLFGAGILARRKAHVPLPGKCHTRTGVQAAGQGQDQPPPTRTQWQRRVSRSRTLPSLSMAGYGPTHQSQIPTTASRSWGDRHPGTIQTNATRVQGTYLPHNYN